MFSSFVALIIIIITTFILSAFFSGAETGIISLNRIQLANESRKGSKNAKILLELMKTPEDLLTSLLIGNNIVMVAGSVLGASVTRSILGNYGPPVATLIMTIGLLVFGEIIPKIVFYQYAMQLSLLFTSFFRFVKILFYPFVLFIPTFLNMFFNIVQRELGKKKMAYVTKEELKLMMSPYEHFVRIPFYEKEMVYRTFRFSETRVKDVMVPLTDVVSISQNISIGQLIQQIINSGHSRLPVYKDKPHQFTGFVHAKDILKQENKNVTMESILRAPRYVSEFQKLNDLLKEFQQDQDQLAFVIDEYGEISGIITLEDVVEEIVGEIEDEYDKGKKPAIQRAPDGARIINGNLDIYTFNNYFKTKIPPGNYNTVAGFIISQLQRIPAPGDSMKFKKWKLEVLEASSQRIYKIKVSRTK